MRNILYGMVSIAAMISSAHAATFNFAQNPPAGATSVFDGFEGNPGPFSTTMGEFTASFSGDGIVYPAGYSVSGITLAPDNNHAYMSIAGNGNENIVLSKSADSISIWWGSVDPNSMWNVLNLGNTSITGQEVLNAAPSWLVGSQSSAWVTISGLAPFTIANLSASNNAFEYELGNFAAPEPSTWAMMIMGFVGLGIAGYRKREKLVAIR